VTHDQEEALALADTVVLMDRGGRVVQAGTPQELYLRPTSAFALEGEATDGRLIVAGHSLPYRGPIRGRATVIVRAADIAVEGPDGPARPGTVAVAGVLEKSLFLGAHYRHYIRLANGLVMADSPDPRPAGPVRLALPGEKIQVYGRES